MAVLAWAGKSFEVSASAVRLIEELTVEAGTKTKKEDANGVEVSQKEKASGTKVSFTTQLDARLGCRVDDEAKAWLALSRSGQRDKISFGGTYLLDAPFMLTSCKVSDVHILPDGMMLHAKLKLTFEESYIAPASTPQSAPSYGGSSGGSGGGNKDKSPPKITAGELRKQVGDTGTYKPSSQTGLVIGSAKASTQAQVAAANAISSAAKKQSSSIKGGGGFSQKLAKY